MEAITALASSLVDNYSYLMVDLRDPRADHLPLMSSIWPTTAICLIYIFLVKVLGPWYMKERRPAQITNVIVVYNLLQTILSGWMFLQGWDFYVYPGGYSWTCQPVDYSNKPRAIRALNISYIFFLSKFLDMFDSFFFVARKKFSHLSFLHVFHHSIVPWLVWWGVKFLGGGNSAFGPFLNTFVHTVMYFYYMLAALGPQMQKYLWWKKYLTTLQMVQFVVAGLYYLQGIFIKCDYPIAPSVGFVVAAILFWFLFLAFYRKAYVESNKKNI